MRTIQSYISPLLMHNDCVVVPGLGGFVSNYVEAQIDRVQGQLRPPSRQLTFNPKLKHHDGLIADVVAQDLGVSFSEASQLVENFVIELQQQLDQLGSTSIDQVGRLHRNQENKLVFSPFSTNFEIESYGLPSISSYPILRTAKKKEITEAAIAKTKAPEAKPLVPVKQSSSIKWQPLAAALATIVIVGFVAIYISMQQGADLSSVAEAGAQAPISKIEKPDLSLLEESDSYTPEYDLSDEEMTTNADLLITDDEDLDSDIPSEVEEPAFEPEQIAVPEVPEPVIKEMPEPSPESIIEDESLEQTIITSDCVIALGAFGSAANVQNLKDKLNDDGFTPWSKSLSSGLTRVGAQVDCDKANGMLQLFRTDYNQGAFIIKD